MPVLHDADDKSEQLLVTVLNQIQLQNDSLPRCVNVLILSESKPLRRYFKDSDYKIATVVKKITSKLLLYVVKITTKLYVVKRVLQNCYCSKKITKKLLRRSL